MTEKEEAVVSNYKLNNNVICVKKEEGDMWYWDKLLFGERIGMPIDPRTQSHKEFSNLFVFFCTTKVRHRIAKTAISHLSIYIVSKSNRKYILRSQTDSIRSIFDILIRSKFQNRHMGRIFTRIEFKNIREESAKKKMQCHCSISQSYQFSSAVWFD